MNFPLRETVVAGRLGVSRDAVRSARARLVEGTDWQFERGKVRYTEEAVGKVLVLLGVEKNAPPAGVQAAVVPEPPRDVETLTVASTPRHIVGGKQYHFVNRRVILARRENGETVLVTVHSSENFRRFNQNGKPMQVRAYRARSGWFLEGRSPRYPGRY